MVYEFKYFDVECHFRKAVLYSDHLEGEEFWIEKFFDKKGNDITDMMDEALIDYEKLEKIIRAAI